MCNETSKAQTPACVDVVVFIALLCSLTVGGKIPLFRWQFKNNLQTCLLTVVYLQISLTTKLKPASVSRRDLHTLSWRQAGLESRGNECRHRGPSAGNVLPQSPELRSRDFFFFHVNYIQGQNHMQLHRAIAKPSACSGCLQSTPGT